MWAGFYIGGNVGVARNDESCTQVNSYGYYGGCTTYYGSSSQVSSSTGGAAGPEIGYDWQMRDFVTGVVADWTWTNLRNTQTASNVAVGDRTTVVGAQVNWLASVRARAGLALDDTMIYFTGGLALGRIQDSNNNPTEGEYYGTLNSTRVGWVAGTGIEHKFVGTPWSVKGEFLYYDLGRANSPTVYNGSEPYGSQFSNTVMEARIGADWRW
jgi:outer membrane immunogenic protein